MSDPGRTLSVRSSPPVGHDARGVGAGPEISVIRIVLPSFNEEKNIEPLLRDVILTMAEFAPHRPVEIVVVDDGSTDGTAERIAAFATALDTSGRPAVVLTAIRHQHNRGLAEAIKTGLEHCAHHSGERDIILTMDADNSHTPGLIPSMVRLIQEGHDVVIASRYQRGARVVGLSAGRRALSLGASWLLRILFPIPSVRDYTCGFRAYRASLVQRVLREDPEFVNARGFTVMVDILLKLRALRPQVLVTEVPLLLRYDRKKSASKMDVPRTIRDTLALVLARLFARRRRRDGSPDRDRPS